MAQKPFTNMTKEDMKFGYFVIGQGVKYRKRWLSEPEQFTHLMDIVKEEFQEMGIKLVYYCKHLSFYFICKIVFYIYFFSF